MKIRAGYQISYDCPQPTPMILQLSVHPSRVADLENPDRIRLDPPLPGFSVISLEPGRSTPHLTVAHPKGAGSAESVLVATGAAGGFVASNYAISYDVRADRLQWLNGQMDDKREYICGKRFTLADILLFCWLEFGNQVGQPLDPANANIVACSPASERDRA